MTHERMIPLELNQHGLHAFGDTVLALPHQIRHGLVHLDDLGLSRCEGHLDAFVVSRSSILSNGPPHLGQIITLVMLRLMSMSRRGERP